MTLHPFDDAMALAPGSAPGESTGHTSDAYWNMVGPYGGITAAQALNVVLQHPQRLGEPIALTVNFAAALARGTYTAQATPARTNRATQHWTVTLSQANADGHTAVVATATVVTATRRDTWSASDEPMPAVPAADAVARVDRSTVGVAWLQRYAFHPITGDIPSHWDDRHGDDSLTQMWLRDEPARPLDFASLAAAADVFFPRVWLRRARRVPVGTVSMTVYFHADARQLHATGKGLLLGQARAQAFRHGFFDQTAQLWNEAGLLLATSHQIVYYRE